MLLQTLFVGICGSDLHIWQRNQKAVGGAFDTTRQHILGHEASARVLEVGSAVCDLQVGDIVAVEPGVPCCECSDCRCGRYNLCRKVVMVSAPPNHGTMTRLFKHPAAFCYKLLPGMSPQEGALMEPLSVAVYACQRASIQVGQTVLICGAGPIGLLALMTAKTFGASYVCMTDVRKERLQVAKAMGADATVTCAMGEDAQAVAVRVIAGMGGRHADVTIDCVGIESSVTTGIHATRQGGVLVYVGLGQFVVSIPLMAAMTKEVDLKGVARYKNTWPLCMQLVAEGRINVKQLVSHCFPLTQALDAFQLVKQGSGIKVLLDCSIPAPLLRSPASNGHLTNGNGHHNGYH